MPKVLVAGESSFLIHSFNDEELQQLEINRSRNASVMTIGAALDGQVTEQKLEMIKADIMMLLKQSDTWKKAHHNKDMDGFALLVFRAKNHDGKKSYIATWCGQSKAEMLGQNPGALIKQYVQGFPQLFNAKDYHKKSTFWQLMNNK